MNVFNHFFCLFLMEILTKGFKRDEVNFLSSGNKKGSYLKIKMAHMRIILNLRFDM